MRIPAASAQKRIMVGVAVVGLSVIGTGSHASRVHADTNNGQCSASTPALSAVSASPLTISCQFTTTAPSTMHGDSEQATGVGECGMTVTLSDKNRTYGGGGAFGTCAPATALTPEYGSSGSGWGITGVVVPAGTVITSSATYLGNGSFTCSMW